MRKESYRLDQNEQIWMDVKDGESSRYRMKLCCNTLKPRSLSVLRGSEKGFPGSSAAKESACNAGDLGSISGLGRTPGEENGYPFQYSSLENTMDRGSWQATVHVVAESDMTG